MDTSSVAFITVILLVLIAIIYSGFSRIAKAIERIAKVMEKEGRDDEDGGGIRLVIPITESKEETKDNNSARCDVIDIATRRKRAMQGQSHPMVMGTDTEFS